MFACLQQSAREMADVYAEGGTESCAGMTWREQEQARERQQDAEIAARVSAFNSAAAGIPLPSFHRCSGSSRPLPLEVRTLSLLMRCSLAHPLASLCFFLWTGGSLRACVTGAEGILREVKHLISASVHAAPALLWIRSASQHLPSKSLVSWRKHPRLLQGLKNRALASPEPKT